MVTKLSQNGNLRILTLISRVLANHKSVPDRWNDFPGIAQILPFFKTKKKQFLLSGTTDTYFLSKS